MEIEERIKEIMSEYRAEYFMLDCGCCGVYTYTEQEVKQMLREALK